MDSVPPVSRLREDLERANKRLRESEHDPRSLDVLVHEYRLLASMALEEAERLQNTIYEYYNKSRKND
jgi:hypothetical protein